MELLKRTFCRVLIFIAGGMHNMGFFKELKEDLYQAGCLGLINAYKKYNNSSS